MLWLLAACSSEPPAPPPPTIDPAEAQARAEALAEEARREQAQVDQAEATADVSAGEAQVLDGSEQPVQIVLVWQGIGSLHKGFFSDSELTTGLSADLAGTVDSPANIYVRYDSAEFVGSVRLQLRPGTLDLQVPTEGDRIGLQDLAPLTAALASYRSAVAGRYDLRVDSFSIGIESFRRGHACIFGATGQPPTDGRIVSPCVQVDGRQQCGEPSADGVRFEAGVAKVIRSCLDL